MELRGGSVKRKELARWAIDRLKIPNTDWPARPYITLDAL